MDLEPELVSIILPTYNRANLLPDAISSVLAQTYQNWELIIWDDGSTDETGDFCHSLREQRIHYVWSKNQGMSFALNEALKLAVGDWVAFLDDDDQWLEDKLASQVDILTKNSEIDLVFGNFHNFFENKRRPGLGFNQTARAMSALKSFSIDSNTHIISNGFLQGIAKDNFIAFDSAIVRKKVLDSLGPFNQGLRNGMDLEYWWRFGLAGYKAAFTTIAVLNRYKYANGLSGRNIVALRNYIKSLDSCAEYSRKYGREDTLKYLRPAYRNAWQNMISACAMENDKQGMLEAFKQSLKYGFQPGTIRLLVQGFLNYSVTK